MLITLALADEKQISLPFLALEVLTATKLRTSVRMKTFGIIELSKYQSAISTFACERGPACLKAD